jgi:ComF family protein
MTSLLKSLNGWINSGLSFLYPEICQICAENRATPDEGFVCAKCRSHVRWIKPPICQCCGLPFEGAITNAFECGNCRDLEPNFVWARAAVASIDNVREVIHRYKYQRALWFEPFLAGLLVEAAAPQLAGQGWSRLIPVPLHPMREREREFNQAERLAARLSAATDIPLQRGLVQRNIPTRTQTQLTREERRANVRRAFSIARKQKLDGERIILVDDVLTTGATTSACAGVLLAAGAAEVCVWTVARGI